MASCTQTVYIQRGHEHTHRHTCICMCYVSDTTPLLFTAGALAPPQELQARRAAAYGASDEAIRMDRNI